MESTLARILMVAPQPYFRARGTPFSVLHRIRALCDGGHTVDLLTYPFGEDLHVDGLRIIRCARVPGVGDVRVGPSIAKLLLDCTLLAKTLSTMLREDYDVLHSHEEAAFFCQPLARWAGIPHVYDMHSSLPAQLATFSAFNFGPLRWLFERLERYVLRGCDACITICPELAEIAEPLVKPGCHAMIENTGDDAKAFGGGPQRDRRRELGVGEQPVVLYTGTLETYQGIDLLLEAFARLTRQSVRAHLVIVGGSSAQVDGLRRRSEAMGIDSRLTFTGTVHPSEIPGYLQAADVIVSPRCRGTNTPLKIYGYMRSGKPIVATRLLTHTQVLREDTAILVEPTAEALAEGLERALTDRHGSRKIAQAARMDAAERFSDDAYVAKVNALYASVSANRQGAGERQS